MLLPILVFAQLAALPRPLPRSVAPVLEFPSPLDDSAAYQGYRTRFFRDAARNTVQVYLDREGRAVTLLADAEDESAGFTARDASVRYSSWTNSRTRRPSHTTFATDIPPA